MNTKEFAKKDEELKYLCMFLDFYEEYSGVRFVCNPSENPDFVCEDSHDNKIGIELTKIMRPPEEQFWDRTLNHNEEPDYDQFIDLILNAICKKEISRVSSYQKQVKDTILVLQLVDGSISSFEKIIENIKDSFQEHGFKEIWLVDYSGIEAFGDIELFALYPPKNFGYYRRPNPGRKPYA